MKVPLYIVIYIFCCKTRVILSLNSVTALPSSVEERTIGGTGVLKCLYLPLNEPWIDIEWQYKPPGGTSSHRVFYYENPALSGEFVQKLGHLKNRSNYTHGSEELTLYIYGVKESDEGNYTCIFKPRAGGIQSSDGYIFVPVRQDCSEYIALMKYWKHVAIALAVVLAVVLLVVLILAIYIIYRKIQSAEDLAKKLIIRFNELYQGREVQPKENLLHCLHIEPWILQVKIWILVDDKAAAFQEKPTNSPDVSLTVKISEEHIQKMLYGVITEDEVEKLVQNQQNEGKCLKSLLRAFQPHAS